MNYELPTTFRNGLIRFDCSKCWNVNNNNNQQNRKKARPRMEIIAKLSVSSRMI